MTSMMRKLTKHTKRRGAAPIKVLFSVEVLSVCNLLPALASIGDEATLSVCFERGGKMSCSTGIPFNSSPQSDGTLVVKQTLSLVATLYQEAAGDFQEKTAKLILRQSKTSRIVGTVYKGLGVVTLKLNDLMQQLLVETNKELSFPMEILKGGNASINIVISARTLASSEGDEDTSSLLSDSSDISTMGAMFDPDDFPIGALMTMAGTGGGAPGGKMVQSPPFQTYSEKKERRKSRTETIQEVDEEDDSPIGEDEVSNWLGEEDFIATNRTTADDSTISTNSPMTNLTSPSVSNGSPMNAKLSPMTTTQSIESSCRSAGSPEVKDVVNQAVSNSHMSVMYDNDEESEPSRESPVINFNKYDNSKNELSHQSAVTESKNIPQPIFTPPRNILNNRDPVSKPTEPSSVAKKKPSIILEREENSEPSSMAKTNPSVILEREKKIPEAKTVTPDKTKFVDVDSTNKNFRNNEVQIIEEYVGSPSATISTTITTATTKIIETTPPNEKSIEEKEVHPAVAERNNFPPYLTPPLGSEGEETLEEAAERVGIILPPKMSPEILDLHSRIEIMTKQIQKKDSLIETLQSEATLSHESHRTEVTTLRSDLITAQANLKRETAARTALEKGFVTEENYLTIRYAEAQKGIKELTSEYASCCATLRNTEQDLGIAKKNLKRAKQSEAVELAAALEAAGVAVASALRRAELEEETDGMLEALINSKIMSADLAIQVDEEKKKIFVLRRRLQKYAEKMAAMELATVVQGLERQDGPVHPTGTSSKSSLKSVKSSMN